jgi:hypothetical protein
MATGARQSEMKLIAALGIAAGAGLTLKFLFQGINRKGRILHPAKSHPERAIARVCIPLNSVPIQVLNPRAIRQHVQESRVPAVIRTDEPDAPPPAVELPIDFPFAVEPSLQESATALSINRRFGAAALDAFFILLACFLFVGIAQVFGVSLRSEPFDMEILTGSALLIAIFYVFLFMLGGRGTAGQAWLKLRLN